MICDRIRILSFSGPQVFLEPGYRRRPRSTSSSQIGSIHSRLLTQESVTGTGIDTVAIGAAKSTKRGISWWNSRVDARVVSPVQSENRSADRRQICSAGSNPVVDNRCPKTRSMSRVREGYTTAPTETDNSVLLLGSGEGHSVLANGIKLFLNPGGIEGSYRGGG